MTLAQIRKSNRAKLSRLEKKGYHFSEEYKKYVRQAKGKLKASTIRGNVLAITDKNDRLWIHEKNFGKYYSYDTVQMNKVDRYLTQYNNALKGEDTEKAREIEGFIFSGKISKVKPRVLTTEQEEARLQRLKYAEEIPEYGTEAYWEWRDFERNKRTFIKYGIAHGLDKSFMEAAANDPGVMYRFNNSDSFIRRYIYNAMSEEDANTFIGTILGDSFIEKAGYTHDTILQALH